MSRTFGGILFGLCALAGGIPLWATNIVYPGNSHVFSISGGGEFQPYMENNAAQTVSVFCVDFQNIAATPGVYGGTIDTLSSLIDTNFTGSSSWTYGLDGSNNALPTSAVARYTMAGYLVQQYDLSPGANTGNKDISIQAAVWDLLDACVAKNCFHNTGDYNSWLTEADNWYKAGGSAVSGLQSKIRIYDGYACADGVCNGARMQEMIGFESTFGATASEPGSAALLSLGVALLSMRAWQRRIAGG